MQSEGGEVTQLLRVLRSGSREAQEKLLELLYAELRAMAALRMKGERQGHTLTPTALVHEAYLRLTNAQDCHDRSHFFALAATAMRRVLVDHARTRCALKRGASPNRIDLKEADLQSPESDERLLALDDALDHLSRMRPRQSQVVEMRYFAGLTEEEIASVLGVTARTVNRDWQMARAWLYGHLRK